MTTLVAPFTKRPHVCLLVSLLLLVGVQPFFSGSEFGKTLFRVLLFASLGSAALSCVTNRRQGGVFLALFTPTVVIGVIWWVAGDPWAGSAYLALSMVCTVHVVSLILGGIFRARYVTADTIYAALSVYLLLGLMWAYLYMILEWTGPALDLGDRADCRGNDVELFRTLLGFSYTTLTTLGYGNITPKTLQADALTSVEAMTGQVYVAVLIARLVGMQVGQSLSGRGPGRNAESAQPLRGDGPAGT